MRSRRLSPTARAMPSSRRRSSASITKRFTRSSTPASTLNTPTPVNSCPIWWPDSVASRSRSCLTVSTSTFACPARRRLISATTCSVLPALSNTPPLFDTISTTDGGVAAAMSDFAAIEAMVPWATKASKRTGEADLGHDRADHERAGLAVGVQRDRRPHAGAQLGGQHLVDHDLAADRGATRVGQARGRRVVAERSSLARSRSRRRRRRAPPGWPRRRVPGR